MNEEIYKSFISNNDILEKAKEKFVSLFDSCDIMANMEVAKYVYKFQHDRISFDAHSTVLNSDGEAYVFRCFVIINQGGFRTYTIDNNKHEGEVIAIIKSAVREHKISLIE